MIVHCCDGPLSNGHQVINIMNIHFIHVGLAKNPEVLSIYLHYYGIARVKSKLHCSKFDVVHNKEGVLELSSMSNWGIRTLKESA